ncbi:MAG: O-antigen ligase family protein [Clostridiales bacterium]|jgi:hypothetical protein|nr:O-antigen ligase family protein [Clostridiales bacterium]
MFAVQNHRDDFHKLKQKIDNFIQGKYFIFFCALIAIVFHTMSWTTFGIAFFMGLITFCFSTQKEQLPVFVVLHLVFFVVSKKFIDSHDYTVFIVVFCTMLVLLVASSVYYFTKVHSRPFLKSKLLIPTLVFAVSMFLAGAFTQYYFNKVNFGLMANLAIIYVLMVLFAYNLTTRLSLDCIAKIILVMGLVAAVELLIYFLLNLGEVDNIFKNKLIALGWGVHNPVGIMIVSSIPAAFYFANKHKGAILVFFLAVAFVLYCLQFLTLSRNSMMVGTLIFGAMYLLIFFKADIKTKKTILIVCSFILLCIVVMCFIFKEQFFAVLDWIAKMGFNDSERFDWYSLAWKVFLQNPIFGVGWAYDKASYINAQDFFAVHNTFLQFLVSTGVVGSLTALWMFLKRHLMLYKNFHYERLFFIAIIAVFVVTGLIDLSMNNPMFIVILCSIFACIEWENRALSGQASSLIL